MAIVTNKSRFTLGFETETFFERPETERDEDERPIAGVSVSIGIGESAGVGDGITDVVARLWSEKPASKALLGSGVSIRYEDSSPDAVTAVETDFTDLHWKTQVSRAGKINDLDILEKLLATDGLTEKVRDALESRVSEL